jgi:hypothetical protein
MKRQGILGDIVSKEETGGSEGLLQRRARPQSSVMMPQARPQSSVMPPQPRPGFFDRVSEGASGLFGSIGKGLAGAGRDLKSGLLDYTSGPYADERLSAISSAMLTPSMGRPRSFGERLLTGMEKGKEAQTKAEERDLELRLLNSKLTSPKYEKIKVGEVEVLVDTNPNSPTFQEIIDPSLTPGTSASQDVPPLQSALSGEGNVFGASEIPDIRTAAGGDLGGFFQGLGNAIWGAFGSSASPKRIAAVTTVDNTNLPLLTDLVQAFGSRPSNFTIKLVQNKLPQPNDDNVTFYSKARALIPDLEKMYSEAASVLQDKSAKRTDKDAARYQIKNTVEAYKLYSNMVNEYENEIEFKQTPGSRKANRSVRPEAQAKASSEEISQLKKDAGL